MNRPADDFNLTQFNYLQVPQERWMLNAFTHYEFAPKATGYLEFHFSNNRVDQQLTQANIGGDFLFNTNNPYLDANMRATLVALDAAETGPRTLQQGPIAYTTTPNDGLAVLTAGRRLVELPFRHNVDDHNVWRVALGMKGDLGDVSGQVPAQPELRRVLHLLPLRGQQPPGRRCLAQPLRCRAALERTGIRRWPTSSGRTCLAAAVNAIKINATNITNAEQKVAVATLGGEAFDLPAGAVNFSVGLEWRTAEAEYIPDEYLRSGDVIGFNPGLPTSGDVTVKEIFAEVRVPILAELPFVQNLTANGGYRSSDYDLDGVGRVEHVPVWPRLARRTSRSHSAASFSAPFAHRTSVTCTAACS